MDDNLDSWTKPEIVVVKSADGQVKKTGDWDPDCWLNGDWYYASGSGGKKIDLMKSKDLKNWEYIGDIMHEKFPNDLGVTANDDLSCPNMFKIGNKWMLLCISHPLGCRYYLGGFKDEQFLPESHALMNWQSKGGFGFYFAPESLLTPDGRRVMWAWLFPEIMQSLPRELELVEDGTLSIKPLGELKTLRYDEKSKSDLIINYNRSYKLLDSHKFLQPLSLLKAGVFL